MENRRNRIRISLLRPRHLGVFVSEKCSLRKTPCECNPFSLTLLCFISTDNILKAPPSPTEWWEDTAPSTDIEESSSFSSSDQQPNKSITSEDSKVFQNRGYDAWEKARAEWRTPTASKRRKNPPPVRRDTVIRGVTNGKRSYELPGRMTLSDMISVYHHIWSQQD